MTNRRKGYKWRKKKCDWGQTTTLFLEFFVPNTVTGKVLLIKMCETLKGPVQTEGTSPTHLPP